MHQCPGYPSRRRNCTIREYQIFFGSLRATFEERRAYKCAGSALRRRPEISQSTASMDPLFWGVPGLQLQFLTIQKSGLSQLVRIRILMGSSFRQTVCALEVYEAGGAASSCSRPGSCHLQTLPFITMKSPHMSSGSSE
jgi:hypothetical protein